MCDKCKEINILSKEGNIFSYGDKYVIPIYQRAFAWENDQLMQLVEDIENIQLSDTKNYYIGTLIVAKNGEGFEVIDGQQRLTALYLLLNCLGIEVNQNLYFTCREKSNATLKIIKDLVGKLKVETEFLEPGILRGLKSLMDVAETLKKDEFIEKLKKVIIFRVEVPEETDLNRYFEIMNIRGVQLEHQDIIKANLLSNDLSDDERNVFAKIWDACSDMTGYVQMKFPTKKKKSEDIDIREAIFGSDYANIPFVDWLKYKDLLKKDVETKDATEETDSKALDIKSIIVQELKTDKPFKNNLEIIENGFTSIIEFPFLLLHTLKLFIKLNHITLKSSNNSQVQLIEIPLDDKKLVASFNYVINNGVMRGELISDNKTTFSKEFVMCLLRTRYLFDRYIIKKDDKGEESSEKWSLKTIKKTSANNTELVNSSFDNSKCNDLIAKKNRMIQAALRVSYTVPQSMHWITEVLLWLSEDDCTNIKNHDMEIYCNQAEMIARERVKKYLIDSENVRNGYKTGTSTPHIVLNYLDYLLWRSNPMAYKHYDFSFRNSVEHWYPQNPTECDKWEEVDRFGNLCLLQRNVNARFSNLPPEAKKVAFKDRIKKASLKLQKMSDETVAKGALPAWRCWKDYECKLHEDEMLEILRADCGLKTSG